MPEAKNNSSVEKEPTKKIVSIGLILANARNTIALSQSDVAEQINLPLHIIQALETDNYDNLPESTYVRGYLRNYARVVGVNEEGLAKLYIEQHHNVPIVEITKQSKQSYDPAILWSSVAVFSILFGLVITWWFDYNALPERGIDLANNERVMAGEQVDKIQASKSLIDHNEISSIHETNVDVLNENTILTIKETTTIPSLAGARSLPNRVKEEITADQQQAMEEASQNPTLVSSIEGAQVLTVTYVEKSWTEIRDADSNTLMQGLIEPGVVRDLSGKPPFEIFLGNAPGVVIEVNGLYFDHSQYNRSNRTARFQVSSGSLN